MYCFKKKKEVEILYKSGLTQEEVQNADKDNMTIFLDEGKSYLESVSESRNRLVNKGTILLGVVLAIMCFLTDKVYSGWIDNEHCSKILIIYDVLLIVPFTILLLFFISPFDMYPIGTIPKYILTKKSLNFNNNELIHNLLINYQTKIQSNLNYNNSMRFWYKLCVILILIPALIVILMYAFPVVFLNFL